MQMNTMLLKLYVKFQDLASREEGQDLVEYALVVALIAFGATAGMKALATGLNTAFSGISTTLGSYVS
jgi:pilus assembly protein Flp/PilA